MANASAAVNPDTGLQTAQEMVALDRQNVQNQHPRQRLRKEQRPLVLALGVDRKAPVLKGLINAI